MHGVIPASALSVSRATLRAVTATRELRDALRAPRDIDLTAIDPRGRPQGLHIASFEKPTPDELAHDFLWRIRSRCPQPG
jgi:polyphosphate kinase 2 (PPK2 family)